MEEEFDGISMLFAPEYLECTVPCVDIYGDDSSTFVHINSLFDKNAPNTINTILVPATCNGMVCMHALELWVDVGVTAECIQSPSGEEQTISHMQRHIYTVKTVPDSVLTDNLRVSCIDLLLICKTKSQYRRARASLGDVGATLPETPLAYNVNATGTFWLTDSDDDEFILGDNPAYTLSTRCINGDLRSLLCSGVHAQQFTDMNGPLLYTAWRYNFLRILIEYRMSRQ